MRQLDARRQLGRRPGVQHLMAHVDEKSLPRSNGPGHFEGLFDGQMGRVVLIAEGVEHQDFCAPGRLHGGWRHRMAVGVIGQEFASVPVEHEPVGDKLPVRERLRMQLIVPEEKRSVKNHRLGPNIRLENRTFGERVSEGSPQRAHGFFIGIDRHATVFHLTKAPQVVEAQDVIAVRVGVDYGVQFPQSLTKALRAKIRRSVENEADFGSLDEGGRAQALIARVRRGADLTIATNYRNPRRGSRPEKSHCKLRHFFA